MKNGIVDNNSSLTESINFSGTSPFDGNNTMNVATGGTINFGGAWNGAYTLTKTGGGSFVVSGSCGYTSTTAVNTGGLLLATGGSINGTAGVTVAAGATFGTVSTNAAALGITAAQAPAYSLTLGNATSAQSNLALNLYSASSDTITAGALTLTGSGTAQITLSNPTGATLNTATDAYTLMTWTSSSTTVTPSDFSLAAGETGTFDVENNTLYYTAMVPEPSTWALLLAGLASFGTWKRRALAICVGASI